MPTTRHSSSTEDNKARITITLRQSLLPQLDRCIDGEQLRNRSHAIEYILSQYLGAGIEHVVVFCGGNGPDLPALTVIQQRPVIAYWLDMMKAIGVRSVIVVIDKYGDPLKEYLGTGQSWGVQITYVRDTRAVGTAHALSLVQPLLETRFVLLYSDMLMRINLNDMAEHHQQAQTVATMGLTYTRDTNPYGVARMEGTRIVEFSEKLGDTGQHGLVNAGVFLFEPTVFDYLDTSTRSLETQVLPRLAKDKQLTGYPFQSPWFDVSRQSGRQLAQDQWDSSL